MAAPTVTLYLLLRRAWRQLAAAEAYRDVATLLGLRVDTRGLSLRGTHDERALWVGEVMTGHGTAREKHVLASLSLRRPLGLGLLIRRPETRRFFRRRNSPLDAPPGGLAGIVQLSGDDRARVHALLGGEDVASALRDLVGRWPDVVVTDHAIRVHLDAPEPSADGLRALVFALERLARALERAREGVPVPDALLPLRERFAAAERAGWSLEPALPALHGRVDGQVFLVTVRREEAGYAVAVRVLLAEPRDAGLRIGGQRGDQDPSAIGQDIHTGDPAFDGRFVVKGYDPDAVRARLDPSLRASLLALAGIGRLEVDDRSVFVSGLPIDDDRWEEALARAAEIARRLDEGPA